MNLTHRLHRLSISCAGVALAGTLLHPLAASAQWSVAGAGPGAAAATTMPNGATPSAAAGGSTVRVSWAAVTMGSGAAVSGYVIHRYNAINGGQATVGAGCAGVVTATTCTELSVPSGSWIYTDTPVLANWAGGESSPSSPVSVP